MKTPSNTAWLALLFLTLMACAAQAAIITPVAWYKLGEADSPAAVAGNTGDATTTDSSANGFDLTRTGGPTYSSDTAPNSQGSTLSMDFHGTSDSGDFYSRSAPVTTAISDVGMEAWVKPDGTEAPSIAGYVAYNGRGGADGYGFIQGGAGLSGAIPTLQDNHWYALIGSTAQAIDMGPVTAGQWVHLGMAIDGSGNVSVYENGVLLSSPAETVVVPNSFLASGGFQIGGYAPLSVQYFAGEIDQVRVFTYTGTFSPDEFLIPEPASLSLLVGGVLMLLRRRK